MSLNGISSLMGIVVKKRCPCLRCSNICQSWFPGEHFSPMPWIILSNRGTSDVVIDFRVATPILKQPLASSSQNLCLRFHRKPPWNAVSRFWTPPYPILKI